MKSLFIILLVIISISTKAQTEWAPIGAKWYYDKPEGMMSGAVGYVLISSTKDTIIGSKNIRVLTVDYYKSNDSIVKYPAIYTYYESGKVYYWNNDQFFLLYNFNATKDTVWQIINTIDHNSCGAETFGSVIVDSVRAEQIGQNNLKCLYVSPNKSSVWEYRKVIEPIGSTFYMLPTPVFCGVADDFPFAAPLRCYEDHLLGIVHFDLFTKCDFISTAIEQFNKGKIIISPNPFSSFLALRFATQPNHHVNLVVFNLIGSVVYSLDNLTLEQTINLEFLKPGIYLFQILENNNVILSNKILKI